MVIPAFIPLVGMRTGLIAIATYMPPPTANTVARVALPFTARGFLVESVEGVVGA